LKDELRIDALASDYAKRRKGIAQCEKKILRYLRSKGPDTEADGELRSRLEEEGLGAAEWSDLLRRSGAGRGGEMEVDSLGHLGALLAQIETIVDKAKGQVEAASGEDLVKAAGQVSTAVKSAIERTEEKIRELAQDSELHPRTLSRRKMIEILAEIVQELCQPLSVINCTLEMLLSGKLGAITDSMTPMIKLALESSERIRMLTESIRRLSGEPESRKVALGITSSFYVEQAVASGG
jgi:signal transduction histidine kinase